MLSGSKEKPWTSAPSTCIAGPSRPGREPSPTPSSDTARRPYFIHGVGTGALPWRHVTEQLSPSRRCVAVDLALHGRTPAAVDQDFTLGGLARVIADFCDALQLNQVDLVANDTAGAVAQVFAVNHVGRVRTMTLTNCDTHDNLPPDALKPAVELAASGQLAAMVPQLIGDLDVAPDVGDRRGGRAS